MSSSEDRIVFRLTGTEAQHGLPLANLATFVDSMRRALRDFDRQQQGAKTAREGHPTARDELVTALRLVHFKPGSALMELEPIDAAEVGHEGLGEVEALSVANLRAFIDSLGAGEIIDPTVTDAVETARKQLGDDGRIEISVGGPKTGAKRRTLVIDAEKIASLEASERRLRPRRVRVSGRLHMVDLEPGTVAVRAADGVDWICSYSPDRERDVLALVGQRVAARGMGVQSTPNKGRLELSDIDLIERFEQTPLFTFERVPLDELISEQGITTRGPRSLLPDDITDDEADDFLNALLEP